MEKQTADDYAILVEHVYKDFKLPHLRKNTLKSLFTGVFDRRNKSASSEVQHALKDISFEINKGEFFGIVGRNGSGKSTLLKILAGIYQPTKGKVHINGKVVPFIELGVGFNPELTGRENVYLNGALLGFTKNEIDTLYDDIVKFAELEKFMDQKLKNYSSGMQVRLAFSMATRARTDILLVDEVLAVGDADFQRKCYNYFKSLKKQHVTVIFVTHDMGAVREYCDRAILIDENQIKFIGSSDKVATEYTKLFNQNGDKHAQNSEKKRWGSGEVTFTSVNLEINKKGELHMVTEIRANSHLSEVIIGFRVKDTSGVAITGTNTKIEKKEVNNIHKGDLVRTEWVLPDIFTDGTYLVDFAATASDGVSIYEWWEDADSFRVEKDRHSPYSVSPNVSITHNDLNNKR